MRGASKVTPQPHQILHLPHKINVISDLRHIWNVISNARSQSSHPPTSPNTAPATKSCRSRFARKIPEVLPPIERRFDHNPRIIRGYPTIKSSSRTRRFGDLTRPSLETILYCKIQHFASRLSPKMSRSAAPVTKRHPPTSPNTAPATQNDPPTSPNTAPATQNQCHHVVCVTYETSFPMRGASQVTLQPHQILRLPRNLEGQDLRGKSLKCFRQ